MNVSIDEDLALPLAVSELALPLDFVSDLLWVSRLIHPLKKNGKSFGKREEIKHEDGGLNYEKKRQRDHRFRTDYRCY